MKRARYANWHLFALLAVLGLAAACFTDERTINYYGEGTSPEEGFGTVTAAEVMTNIENKVFVLEEEVLLDARSELDWQRGHIQDAKSMFWNDIVDNQGSLQPGAAVKMENAVPYTSTPIITYCFGDGNMYLKLAQGARKLGYTDISYYLGGTNEWRDLGWWLVLEDEGLMELDGSGDGKYYPRRDDALYPGDSEPRVEYLIDGRSAADYESGHIPGAISIPASTVVDSNLNLINDGDALTSRVPTDALLVIYCKNYGCELSYQMAWAATQALDYEWVLRYQPGWDTWRLADPARDICTGPEGAEVCP